MFGSGERISSTELFTLMVMFMIGSAIILPKGTVAGHDSWVSVLIATGGGALVGLLYAHLAAKHPGRSLIGLSEQVLGKWGGRVIGLLYCWYSFHLGTLVLKNLEELTVSVLLPLTPPLIVDMPMMLLVVWAVHEGIETIARCSIVIFVVFMLLTVVSCVLLIQDIDINHLLPFVDYGWVRVLEGATKITTFPFGEAVLFLMVMPFLNQTRETKKTTLWAVGIAGFFLLLDDLRNILIFSELTANVNFPSYTAISFIAVADFLERVEPFGFLAWGFSGFIKICVCLLCCTLCLTQTFGLKKYRPYLLPIAALMIELAQFIYTNQAEMLSFAEDVWAWYSLPFQVIIPLLLLLFARLRSKHKTPATQKDL